jgi:competence protein ComGC
MKVMNSRTIKSIFALIILLLSLLPMMTHADEACGEQQKQTSTYKAFESCQEALAAKDTNQMRSDLSKLTTDGYCSTLGNIDPDDASLRNLCKDPAAAACSFGGNTFNSKCQIDLTSPSQIADTPDYVTFHCEVLAKREKFIQDHKRECPSGMSLVNCEATIKIKYRRELLQIERDAVYTPEKIKKISSMFNRVKQKYIEMIGASTIIPQSKKAL